MNFQFEILVCRQNIHQERWEKHSFIIKIYINGIIHKEYYFLQLSKYPKIFWIFQILDRQPKINGKFFQNIYIQIILYQEQIFIVNWIMLFFGEGRGGGGGGEGWGGGNKKIQIFENAFQTSKLLRIIRNWNTPFLFINLT